MIKSLRTSFVLFLGLTLLTGLIYPFMTTMLAQLFFPFQANGSLIRNDAGVAGSTLIGQYFNQPQYFWGRLSATGERPYNASLSGGSNLSATNPVLEINVKNRIRELLDADPNNTLPIPIDLVTSSASGLDPDISVAAALYQAQRIATFRGLAVEQVIALIQNHIKNRFLGVLGEPRVNVLELNMALDAQSLK